jgi:hypothetical protein
MKTFPFGIALPLFAASFAHAGPILIPPSNPALQVVLELDVVGQFELEQTGNEITGNYKLTETDQTNSYEVISPSSNQIVGEFQLTETSSSGSFQLEESSSNQSLYVLVESGNQSVGTYTADQGNEITGNYQLAIQTRGPSVPEPGSLGLAAMGAGLLVLGSYRRRARRPTAVIPSGSEGSAFDRCQLDTSGT